MYNSEGRGLTDLARAFLEPANTTQRQYEALRAYFVDQAPSKQAAERFGYTPGSFRVLCHQFRSHPGRAFFLANGPGPRPATTPHQDDPSTRQGRRAAQAEPLCLRHRGGAGRGCRDTVCSGHLAILPRRASPACPAGRRGAPRPVGPLPGAVADVRQVDLSSRSFRTELGGLFLFVPMLAATPFDALLRKRGSPARAMVPAGCAMRSLLALKLFGAARHSHVMSDVFDEGLASSPGSTPSPSAPSSPSTAAASDPACYPKLMRPGSTPWAPSGSNAGVNFHLDFHTIPFHGEDALVEKHYVSKRSRRQKGMLAFLAQDADRRVFCYANADIRKDDQNDEILRFVEFWKQRTGRLPEELIFDSKLTTYANLDALEPAGHRLHHPAPAHQKLLARTGAAPPSAWRRIELESVSRAVSHPRILDQTHRAWTTTRGRLRQIAITDLGHEEPTLLLTNQLRRSAARPDRTLRQAHAHREHHLRRHRLLPHGRPVLRRRHEGQLRSPAHPHGLAASTGLLGQRIGGGYSTAESRHIFRDFVQASARVTFTQTLSRCTSASAPTTPPARRRLRRNRHPRSLVAGPPAQALLRLI